MAEGGPRGRKRKGPPAAEDDDFPSASGPKRGHLIQDASDSEEEELQREARSKQGRPADAEQPADLNDLGEEELKVYVAQQKSMAAERALYGKGTGKGAGKGEQGLECRAPSNLTQYEKEMGYTIEPFNTDEERRTGRFDPAGFWTRERDEDEEPADPWLAEVDEAGKAGGPALAAPGNGRGGAAAEAADEDAPRETYELYAVLLAALRPGETLPAAIRRLKPAKAPAAPKWKQRRQKGQSEDATEAPAAAGGSTAAPPGEEAKAADTSGAEFDKVMEAAHTLMDAGVVEVYSYTYEELAQRAARLRAPEPSLGPPTAGEAGDAPPATAGRQWEFCWAREPGAEVYGPYSSEQMQGWKEHGFFSAERVAYARVKDEDMFAAEETEFQEAHTMDFVA
nr:U5 snRNP 52K protein (U5-52K) [Euglena gracilis]